jgi:hypothetical protein
MIGKDRVRAKKIGFDKDQIRRVCFLNIESSPYYLKVLSRTYKDRVRTKFFEGPSSKTEPL